MATRIGVDVGGTFTDLIFYDDESGEVRVAKEPTTPASPEQGVIASGRGCGASGAGRLRLDTSCTGPRSASIAARRGRARSSGCSARRGFRDVLEIRRGDRDEMYNLFWAPPPPLVPRRGACR